MMETTREVADASPVEVIKDFDAAYEARDVDAMLEFFAVDADLTAGPGTFRGKDEIAQFLRWDVGLSPTIRKRQIGVGVVASGRAVITENVIEATYEGIPYEHPITTVYELADDGKIQHMRAYYDKLAIDQQVTSRLPGLQGWFARRMVNYIVSQGEKGLR
jgi:limonene-1,2-epoxide hydrolase